jgi:hypothetical protein
MDADWLNLHQVSQLVQNPPSFCTHVAISVTFWIG